MPGPLPNGASFSNAPVAALASLNDFPFNFGHALFDFLLPVYNMLSVSGKRHRAVPHTIAPKYLYT